MRAYWALLVSDGATAFEALGDQLIADGFRVIAKTFGTAARAVVEEPVELTVVDAREKFGTAIQLCRSLRATQEVGTLPIILIVGPGDERARMDALEAGADDCFSADLSPREQILRLRAAARRHEPANTPALLRYADIELDIHRYKVRRRGAPIRLTTMQTRLLRYLMEHPTIVFSRRQLLETVWRDTRLDEGAVTASVTRLRRLLNSAGGPNVIRNVPGIGYALDAEADDIA